MVIDQQIRIENFEGDSSKFSFTNLTRKFKFSKSKSKASARNEVSNKEKNSILKHFKKRKKSKELGFTSGYCEYCLVLE